MNSPTHVLEEPRFDPESSLSTIDDDGMSERGSAVGHSLPTPEEVKNYGSPVPQRRVRLLVLIGVLFLAAIIGLSLGLTVGRRGNKDGSLSAAEKRQRRKHAKDYLIHHGISTQSAFDYSGSPQSQALEFVAVDDARRLDVPRKSSDGQAYEFVTRYVLAVVYFATGGPSWTYRLRFLSQYHTCDWYNQFKKPVGRVGVLCNQQSGTISGISLLYNNLHGDIPEELGHLTTMTYVEFVGNNVGGTLPNSLKQLTDMDSLVLANNYIAGSIPEWIVDMDKMKFLYLSNNVMTGTIPSGIKNLKDLRVIGFDDNDFHGSMEFIWALPKLQYVLLENNKLTGEMPREIRLTSPDLINLDLSDNLMGGELSIDLFRLSALKILDLHGNSFTGGIPHDESDNQALQFLALYDNKLTAVIPPTISHLRNLTHLDLSYNSLQGDIPAQISQLSGLTYLFLSENTFSEGSVPSSFYGLKHLKELSLKNTNRIGGILPVVSFLPELVMLDLDDNGLTGTIPPEIGDMPKLQFLLLNRNKLSGDVPTQLANLEGLQFLLLDNNDLTGDMRLICNNTAVTLAIADCDELSCHCCSCCYDGQECHDNDLVANLDPLWERAYERTFYNFANTTDATKFELEEEP